MSDPDRHHPSDAAAAGAAAAGADDPPSRGGDPACWLDRVCDACGRLVETGTTCPACGAPLPAP